MSELHFMSIEELDNKLKKSDSGIYFIKDYNDNIIYVGKAFSIKSRVLAHFNSYSNIEEYVHLFNKVAYLIEDSLLKRSLLQVTYMIKYKPVLNKEVQKEFPELYTQYIKQTNKKSMLLEIDEAKEKGEELKNKLVKLVGGKTMFYDIISLLNNGYNYHVLAKVLSIELQTLIIMKEHRNKFPIPH
ncbi:nucleotide excision repair endonuclease, partial [Bacillus thuringiensis]